MSTPPVDPNELDWVKEAKCAGLLPLFFPQGEGGGIPAKKVCRGQDGSPPCPVREQCLSYALSHREIYGIWGGFTAKERRRFLRRRAIHRTRSRNASMGYVDYTYEESDGIAE